MSILNIVSIICFALCLLMFFYFKWYIKKRTSFSGLEERQSELAQLIAEIDRITDRDSQLVEDRVNKLKTLLHDVDKRIALYEKDLENLPKFNSEKSETLYTSLGKGIRAALADSAMPNAAAESSVTKINTAVTPAVLNTEGRAQQKTGEQGSSAPGSPLSKRHIRVQIDILANDGLPPDEIAKRLNISIAEVNLAMNLRRKN